MFKSKLNMETVEGFNKMKSIFKTTTVFLALVLLTGCFGEEEKAKTPKKDYIVVKNDSVENFEVKLQTRLKDQVLIPFNETVKIDFRATKTKTVLVQTKSQDPNWNNCSIAMQVGQTLIVYRKYESIECRAE